MAARSSPSELLASCVSAEPAKWRAGCAGGAPSAGRFNSTTPKSSLLLLLQLVFDAAGDEPLPASLEGPVDAAASTARDATGTGAGTASASTAATARASAAGRRAAAAAEATASPRAASAPATPLPPADCGRVSWEGSAACASSLSRGSMFGGLGCLVAACEHPPASHRPGIARPSGHRRPIGRAAPPPPPEVPAATPPPRLSAAAPSAARPPPVWRRCTRTPRALPPRRHGARPGPAPSPPLRPAWRRPASMPAAAARAAAAFPAPRAP
eukprot:356861-Chlamydomonas_euryale.AAC.6